MSNIVVFDKKGKKTSKKQDVNAELFGLEVNEHLLYLAKVRQESNARAGTAHTKTRMEVRGGGAKPWRQKGTGRARAGSSRSPLWRGGGVIFGPRNNVNWTKGMNAKETQRALVSALNFLNADGRLSAIEELAINEAKTKEIANILKTAELEGKNVVFVVESENTQTAILKRASKNLVDTKVITTAELNVKDLLKADQVIMTSACFAELEERFSAVLESAKNKEAVAA
jgi:large subunit ribosomal protein L4